MQQALSSMSAAAYRVADVLTDEFDGSAFRGE
jgi:hypothetical protein